MRNRSSRKKHSPPRGGWAGRQGGGWAGWATGWWLGWVAGLGWAGWATGWWLGWVAGLGYLGYWATMVWANGLGKATRDIKVIGFD